MLVTPPAAAAAAPLSIRSLCSAPGSPSWTRMSTRPGARHRPLASITSAPPGASADGDARPDLGDSPADDQEAAAAVEPGRRVEQAGVDDDDGAAHAAGSPPVAGEHVEHGHPHRHAHLDLVQDGAAVDVVGDHAVDLDAAVHRPGVHDQRVRLGRAQLVVGQAVEVEVLGDRRHEAALHALGLQAQHHDDVHVLEAALHVGEGR